MGGKLIHKSLDEASKAGHRLVFLVGDAPYYTRFGFKPVKNKQVTLPGPADPQRFLVCELVEGAFEGITGPMRGCRLKGSHAAILIAIAALHDMPGSMSALSDQTESVWSERIRARSIS